MQISWKCNWRPSGQRGRGGLNPYSKFVNIEAIWTAQNEANGVEIEEEDEEGSDISGSEKSYIEVQF